MRSEKGVAGLTVLLSAVALIFVIGFLVMIFALMGGGLRDSTTLSASRTATTTDTSLVLSGEQVTLTACNDSEAGAIYSVASVYNNTVLVTSPNYTYSGCVLDLSDATYNFNESLANVTYTYTYAGEGYTVIDDTVDGIAEVTTWFPIVITITVMVVLILLTVIIIGAIRGSGLLQGGTA